jgi:hypothetical protein
MKQYSIKLTAEIVDSTHKEQVIFQDLSFVAASPAIHDAIESMGGSFIRGLSMSLSRDTMLKSDAKQYLSDLEKQTK